MTMGCLGGSQYLCGPFLISWAYWADGGKFVLANDNPDRLGGNSLSLSCCYPSIIRSFTCYASHFIIFACHYHCVLLTCHGYEFFYCKVSISMSLTDLNIFDVAFEDCVKDPVCAGQTVSGYMVKFAQVLNSLTAAYLSPASSCWLVRNRIATMTGSSTVMILRGFTLTEVIRVRLPSTNHLSTKSTFNVDRTSHLYPVNNWMSHWNCCLMFERPRKIPQLKLNFCLRKKKAC